MVVAHPPAFLQRGVAYSQIIVVGIVSLELVFRHIVKHKSKTAIRFVQLRGVRVKINTVRVFHCLNENILVERVWPGVVSRHAENAVTDADLVSRGHSIGVRRVAAPLYVAHNVFHRLRGFITRFVACRMNYNPRLVLQAIVFDHQAVLARLIDSQNRLLVYLTVVCNPIGPLVTIVRVAVEKLVVFLGQTAGVALPLLTAPKALNRLFDNAFVFRRLFGLGVVQIYASHAVRLLSLRYFAVGFRRHRLFRHDHNRLLTAHVKLLHAERIPGVECVGGHVHLHGQRVLHQHLHEFSNGHFFNLLR